MVSFKPIPVLGMLYKGLIIFKIVFCETLSTILNLKGTLI